jgi:polyisoprenoid-binding protein YceI
MGLIVVNGVFRSVSGKGSVSAEGTVSGSVTIAAASLDTKNARRDEHLRSADFFGSDDNPDITFTANSIRPSSGGAASGGAAVDGTLTVRGNSRPLSFEAAVSAHGDAAPSGHRVSEIWLDAEVRVNRADFGLTWNFLGTMSVNSVITVHAVFIR